MASTCLFSPSVKLSIPLELLDFSPSLETKLGHSLHKQTSLSLPIGCKESSLGGFKKRVKFFFEFNLQGHSVTLYRQLALSWGYRLIDLLMHFIRVTLNKDYSIAWKAVDFNGSIDTLTI